MLPNNKKGTFLVDIPKDYQKKSGVVVTKFPDGSVFNEKADKAISTLTREMLTQHALESAQAGVVEELRTLAFQKNMAQQLTHVKKGPKSDKERDAQLNRLGGILTDQNRKDFINNWLKDKVDLGIKEISGLPNLVPRGKII